MTRTTEKPIIEAKEITKSFPGVLALNRVDLTLHKGEVHALVGENGAGKSTLSKIISGIYPMDAGKLFKNGIEIEKRFNICL